MGRSKFLVSASQYAHLFRWQLKQCGVDLIMADELICSSSLFELNQMPKVILDHPLGLSKSVKSFCLNDRNYVSSSWSAFLQGLSGEVSWQSFCPWLWIREHVVQYLPGLIFDCHDVGASTKIMPFYLLEHRVRPRKIAVRLNGSWHGDIHFQELTQCLDHVFDSQILTVEWALQNDQWRFLQTYPGLPWGHYVNDPMQMMSMLSDLFDTVVKKEQTIARCFRPFCQS